jgi:hypothetical protein
MPNPPHPVPRPLIAEAAYAAAHPELAALATSQIRERQSEIAGARSRLRRLESDYAATMRWMAEQGWELPFPDSDEPPR